MGDYYFRFYNNGSPVLETALAITNITQANPGVVSVTNTYTTGSIDWVYITGVVGMTELNNKYYIIQTAVGGAITLTDLDGNQVDTSAFTAYISGGTVQRIYTLASPYAATDLATVKFAQNINTLIMTQENYSPYILTLSSAINWSMIPIVFGATILAPTGGAVATTLAAGSVRYGYVITSVDINGQESSPSSPILAGPYTDLRTIAGTNTLSWTARSGVVSYNIYKASPTYAAGGVPVGAQYGFIGNVSGVSISDSNISPDFSQTPPIARNPFIGAGVTSVSVTAPGNYASGPITATVAAPTSGVTALVSPNIGLISALIGTYTGAYTLGNILPANAGLYGNPSIIVTSIGPGNVPLTVDIYSPGTLSGAAPASIVFGAGALTIAVNTVVFGVTSVTVVSPGSGYTAVPAITFSSGTATAVAIIDPPSSGNPTVPGYFGQRLFLGGPVLNPQGYNFSKPTSYFNFDVSNPIAEDDAISGTLSSTILNTIKAVVPMPAGLIVLCDQQAWLLNSGTTKSGVDPINIDASPQAYNGCNDMPPIVANFDILYVDAKNSIVRDNTYNFYTNIFSGTDITVLSSHLFYGYSLLEWAYCEEPFKLVYVIRNDGILLALTFMKEQELIGWTHSDTEGLWKSVASVIEPVDFGYADVPYFVVERVINGNTVKYIERMAERYFPNGATDAWCVDAGLQYRGVPATSFSGGEHLAGATVVGLADGLPITSFVMPVNGNFTLPTAASVVTIGLAFTPDLQTLPIDLGAPTIQGEEKKITGVTVRVADTLGLEIGGDETTLVPMDDLILGNVGKDTNEIVTGLVTGDSLQVIDSAWTIQGQYFIRQPQPLPVTILGVIPQITIGSRKS